MNYRFETKHYFWSVSFWRSIYYFRWLPSGGSAKGRLARKASKGWRYEWLGFALVVERHAKQPPKPF